MMASDGAAPLPGQDMAMTPGGALTPFTALPFALPDQLPWDPAAQAPIPQPFSPGNPLLLSTFPNPLLVTDGGGSGPGGPGAGQVIVQAKTEGRPVEPSQTQKLILTQPTLNWIVSGAPCGVSEVPARYVMASDVNTLLPTVAVRMSQEGPSGIPQHPVPPTAQLAPIMPLEKAWPGTQGTPREGGLVAAGKPPQGDLACASKGVYENYRRWQRYKALARTHLSRSPDAEALSCFLIPVLRSLARLKPTMTLEEGLPKAMQEWEHTSNFERMIFYEMAEKFMEFEAEEETQMQNIQLMNGSLGLSSVTPLKLDPPGPMTSEPCQQPVYIPKKAVSKTRASRRRQRKPQKPPVPEAPKEIPPEAVQEYIDIMEGLMGSSVDAGKSGEEQVQQEDGGLYPDPSLQSYIDELCSQEGFVSKVEAVIHPQFLADLLSPEEQRDPLALTEELEQEEGLTLTQLVQKRLLALEEEDAQAPPSCGAVQSDSSPSNSDEDEDGGRRPRPSPGLQGIGGTVHPGKSTSPGKRAKETHGGQESVLSGQTGVLEDENTQPSSSSWDLQLEPASSQGMHMLLGMERIGSGKVVNQLSVHHYGHLEGSGSPGPYPVVDRTSEALPLCWQESPQVMTTPDLDVIEPVPLQDLEKQALALQIGQPMGEVGVLVPGSEPLAEPQEGSSKVLWGDDQCPPTVRSYGQNSSLGAGGTLDGVSLSPSLWLNTDLDTVELELPLEIERALDSIQGGRHVKEYQMVGSSSSSASPGPRKTAVPGDVGSGMVPCGGTDATVVAEKRNSCSLPGSLMGNSPALESKDNQEQSPEAIQDPSDLWVDGCSPLLERISVSTLESSKDSLLPTCQSSVPKLGTQDATSFLQVSQEIESRGNRLFSLLETTEHDSTFDVREKSGSKTGVSGDPCPPNLSNYDLQREGREEAAGSSKSKDLVPSQGNQESYTPRTPKLTSYQGLGSTSPRWGARGVLVLKETSVRKAHNSAERAKGSEKEKEKEDKELSSFAYLLASKLSLSSAGLSLSPCHAPGGQGIQKASHSSTESGNLGPPPATNSKKQGLVGGPALTVEKPQPEAEAGRSGEKALTLGVAQSPQPRKRRSDNFVTSASKRKKRRRNQ